jgi:hypothetical protein
MYDKRFFGFVDLPFALGDSFAWMSLYTDKMELGFLDSGLVVGSDGISTSNLG